MKTSSDNIAVFEQLVYKILPDPYFRLLFYRHIYLDYSGRRKFDDTLLKMVKWCDKTMPGRARLLCIGYAEASFTTIDYYNMCFKNKEDLMAFKLVWY